MGIYGFGKAFNLRYVNSGQVARNPKVIVRGGGRPIQFGGGSFTKTTNVTINNGPTGFWGFMSGLFGGLFGGGFLGNLFGGNMFGMGMGMGMPMMGGYSPFGMINQAQMQPQQQQKTGDRLADLQKMFPDWVITSDGNGHYDAVNKDQTVHEEGNFDEMCNKLINRKKEESQGPKEENTPGAAEEGNTPSNTPVANTPSNTPVGNTPSQSGSGNTRVYAKASSRDVSPAGWYRAQTNANSKEYSATNLGQIEKESATKGQSNAQTVVTQHILKSKLNGALNGAQISKLTQEVIKKNPSVFNSDGSFKKASNGTVAMNKLDIPTVEWIKTNILGETDGNRSSMKGPNSATGRAKTAGTYGDNRAAQEGYRRTWGKGIYYNDKTKTHYKLQNDGSFKALPDVKQINKDGSWYDKQGKLHKTPLQ